MKILAVLLLSVLLTGISAFAMNGVPVKLNVVEKVALSYKNPGNLPLETMFRNALLNTTKAQAIWTPDGTVYVQTGDIPAEWLRDSSAQVRPHLLFAGSDRDTAKFISAVLVRQSKCMKKDPYANAFREDYSVWEQKYELDSLAYPIQLAWLYWKQTGDTSVFSKLAPGFDAAVATMELEQHHTGRSHYKHKEMADGGKGRPVAYTGMIWTGFRPSDDACKYNYLIPSEMMAVVALRHLAELEHAVYHDEVKAKRVAKLASEVDAGIRKYGVVHSKKYGKVYAYEVDGKGGVSLGDDANIPSLLSAPHLGYVSVSDPTYKNTRRLVLSSDNPTYHSGTIGSGIGSPHTGDNNYIWPLSLLMQGFTATSQAERDGVVRSLVASDPGDHLLHESFDPNDATHFTRKDFGWPNALFAELILTKCNGMKPLADSVAVGKGN